MTDGLCFLATGIFKFWTYKKGGTQVQFFFYTQYCVLYMLVSSVESCVLFHLLPLMPDVHAVTIICVWLMVNGDVVTYM